MDFAPFFHADAALQIHIVAGLIALTLGPVAILRQRRDRLHKAIGYGWILSMLVTALGSFALDAFILPVAFGFGPIHLLSVYALVNLWLGLRAARAGHIAQHRAHMAGLYWQGLTVAALLTVLPGRTMNRILFPGAPDLGLAMVGGVAFGAAIVLLIRRHRRHATMR